MLKKAFTSVALFGVLTGSCKTTSTNNLESLENFRNSDEALVCKGNITKDFEARYDVWWPQAGEKESNASIVAPTGYKEALKPILAAVPLGLQQWYFKSGGKLQLIGDPTQWCRADQAQKFHVQMIDQNGKLAGCVSTRGSTSGVPNIYVSLTSANTADRPAEISMAVQGFAIVQSYIATRMEVDNEIETAKYMLSFLLTDDIINASKAKTANGEAPQVPETYKKMLPNQKIWDANVDRQARYDEFKTTWKNASFQDFRDFTFAQITESSWCNDNTRAMISGRGALFIQTGKYFLENPAPAIAETDAASIALSNNNNNNMASINPGSTNSNPDPIITDQAPTGDAVQGIALANGRILNGLWRVFTAPYAVARFFVNERPVRTFFANHQPLRRAVSLPVRAARGAFRFVFPGNRCWRLRRWAC